MTTPRPELPPVLLGPESGRKVAEHIELSGKTGELPDPRDEAVGLLREVDKHLERWRAVENCQQFAILMNQMYPSIRALLARIDK